MHRTSSVFAVVVVLLLLMIIDAIGFKRLSIHTQSKIAKIARKIVRLRQDNALVNLKFVRTTCEKQRRDAILDWLGRTEGNLMNEGQIS